MKKKFTLFVFALILCTSKMLAQNSSLSIDNSNHDVSLPVEITADNLTISQTSNAAIFEGTAFVTQGLLRLDADKIVVNYDQVSGEVTFVEATGNVIFTNSQDVAKAESAFYEINNGVLKMSGNVLLTQGKSIISGDDLNMNILKNTATFTGNVKTKLVSDK